MKRVVSDGCLQPLLDAKRRQQKGERDSSVCLSLQLEALAGCALGCAVMQRRLTETKESPHLTEQSQCQNFLLTGLEKCKERAHREAKELDKLGQLAG
jgi:glucose-6-phosphate-specific signal transduction histidine kinase